MLNATCMGVQYGNLAPHLAKITAIGITNNHDTANGRVWERLNVTTLSLRIDSIDGVCTRNISTGVKSDYDVDFLYIFQKDYIKNFAIFFSI